MVYSLSYRRPGRATVADNASAISNDTKRETIRGSIKSGSSGMSNGIPEALSFDNIIAGGTCPVRFAHRTLLCILACVVHHAAAAQSQSIHPLLDYTH